MSLGPYEFLDERFRACVNRTAQLEKLWTGARWTEGPVYFPALRSVLFSDIPNDRMMRYDECDGNVSVFRTPCGYTNGHTVDREGRLVSCEHGGRRVSRTEHDGRITVIADRYNGKRLNSPNDLVVKSDGTIWFTDPPFGILSDYEGHKSEIEQDKNYVFRADPRDGSLQPVADDFRETCASTTSLPTARSRTAACSRPARPDDSTAFASTMPAASGPQPTRACTATTRMAH
jgi:gluconolactonase